MRRPTLAALLATTSLSAVGSLVMAPSIALANPQGGAVVSGGASIVQSPATPNRLVIDQTTQSAVLNWQSFSIGAGQQVVFQQPNAAAIALNRVTGNQASQIAGTLTANGQVWLVNPNGVFFGPSAVVNVAGIVATTTGIGAANFMAGHYLFDRPGAPGATVVNAGHVSVRDGGLAAFVAPGVANSGVINARLGKVALASGSKFTVDLYGDDLVKFAVDAPTATALTGAAVDNSGKIKADGGTVTLSVAAAQSLVDNAINVGGTIQARTASMQNGKIVLSGGGGTVTVGGTLDASGDGKGQTGGTVEVLGGAVALASSATVNVSGSAGGGTALIGGNFHGAGPQPNALSTTVSAGAVIDADATSNGNGGNVAVWSDQATLFDGSITARGGATGGNGGSVETSSRQNLSVGPTASVDTRAPQGKTGTWLLDPASITIDDADPAPGVDDDITSDTGGYPNFATTGTVAATDGGTDAAYLSSAALVAELGMTNVSLSASNSISFGTNTGIAGGISSPGTNSLTLVAGSTIDFAAASNTISVNGGITATAPNILLGTNLAGGAGGVDLSGSTTDTLAASVTISANNAAIKLGGNVVGAGTDTLTLTPGTTGTVSLQAVGNTTPVNALTVTNGAATLGGAIAVGAGGADLSGTTTDTLATDVTISAANAAINLGASVVGAGAFMLTLTPGAAGTASLQVVGNTTPVDALTVTNGATTLNGNVTTDGGGQTYDGAVTLGASVTLTDQGGGVIAFNNTLAGVNNAITIIDDTPPTFDITDPAPTVSGLSAVTLAPFTATNSIAVGDSAAATLATADTSYDFVSAGALSPLLGSAVAGAVTIGSNSSTGVITMTQFSPTVNLALETGGAGSIDVTGAYAGTGSLALVSGAITLSAGVTASGSIMAMATDMSLGADLSSGTGVDLSGTTTDTLAADVTISAMNAAINLGGNVLGSGTFTLTLTPGATGTVSLQAVGNMTAVDALSVTNGAATLDGNISAGAGGVDLSGTTTDTLATDVTISAANAAINLGGNVLGPAALTLTPGPTGTVSLQAVGNTTAVATLTVTNGAATLAGNISAGAGGVDLSGTTTVTLATDVTISAANAAINLGGNVLGPAALTLTPGPTGTVSLQEVGNTTAVAALSVTNGAATLDGNISAGAGGVGLNGTTTDTLATDVTISAANAAINLGGNVLGPGTLTLTPGSTGTASLQAVGNTTAVDAFSVTNGAATLGGNISAGTGGVDLSGTTADTLAANVTISAANGAINLGSNVLGAGSDRLILTPGPTGTASLQAVGNTTAVDALTVTNGATTLDGNVTSNGGGQTYSGAVTLGTSVTLTDLGGGTIAFHGTLAGASNAITVIDNVAPSFGGTVSGLSAATLAPFSGPNTIAVGDSSAETLAGAATSYDFISTGGLFALEGSAVAGAVTIGSSSSGGNITVTEFSPSLDLALVNAGTGAIKVMGAYDATGSLVLTSGSHGISLTADVTASGGITATASNATLGADLSGGAGGVDLSGTTTDTLAADVTISATNAAIKLGGNVLGAGTDTLTVTPGSAGTVSLLAVGNSTAVAALTVTDGAATLGGAISAGAGGVDVSGTTTDTLAVNITISAMNAAINLGGNVLGPGTLTLTPGSTGTASLQAVGNTTAVAALSVTNGAATLDGNISAGAGGVDLSGTTTDTLATDVTISAANAAINLGGNVLGPGTLTLTPGSTGMVSLMVVGNTTVVDALTVTNGAATLGGNISAGAGGVDLSGTTADTLAANVTISAANAAINLGSNVLGAGSDRLTLTPGPTGMVSLKAVGNTTVVDALTVTDGAATLGGAISAGGGGVDLSGTTTDTLAADVTISAANAAINLGGNVLGPAALTLAPGPTGTVSLQDVGDTTAVAALTVTNGAATLAGNISAGVGGVDLSGTTTDTLMTEVTISVANAAINLGGNVLGPAALTLTPGPTGMVSLQDVGNTTAVATLTVTNGAATLDGNISAGAGGVDLSGTTTDTLATDVTISAANAAINLGGNVLGPATLTLTPGSTGTASLQAVGNTTAVGALSVTNGAATLAGNISAGAGGVDLGGTTTDTLATDVTISAANAAINLGGNVLGPGTLTLTPGSTGMVSLMVVGNTTVVDALTVTNGAATLGGNISAGTGGVDLSGTTADTLAANVTISAANAAINLGSNVLGAGSDRLTLTPGPTGMVSLKAVGNTTVVAALTVTDGAATLGGAISAGAGGVDLSGTTTDTLATDVTISAANAAINLGGNVLGPGTLTLTPGPTGTVSLQDVGNTTAVATLTVTNGAATLDGNISAGAGGVDLSGTTTDTLATDVTISAANAAINLGGNVLGPAALTLTPGPTGTVSLQEVGNTTAVATLTVTNGAATLDGNISAGAGGVDLSGTTTDTLATDVTISAANAAINLGGNVLGPAALTLTPGPTGMVSLQEVGNTTAVATLTVTSGAATLDGNISAGAGGVDLSGTTTDTLATDVTISAANAAINLGGNVLGPGTLTLTPGSTGMVSLMVVGNTTAVDALTVTNGTATLGGNISAGTGGVDLSGTTADTLAANVTISAANAAINLGSNVLGAGSDRLTLTPGPTGMVSLKAVGNTTVVAALTVTDGAATLGGAISAGAGGVDLSGTTTDTLATDVTISAANAAINLGGNVLGPGTLTLTPGSTGMVSLQAVGNTTAVDALMVTNGAAMLDGNVTTNGGGQTYDGAVTLGASVTLTDLGGGTIAFQGTIEGISSGGQALSVGTSGGTIALSGNVGSTMPLGSVTLNDGVLDLSANIGITISASPFSETGATVLLGSGTNATATTIATSGGNIGFSGTIDGTSPGRQALTLDAGTGTIALGTNIGASEPLGALTLEDARLMLGPNATIATSGGAFSQTGATSLLGGATASTVEIDTSAGGSTGANISFSSAIDGTNAGSQALVLAAGSSGTITLSGNVGVTTALGAVTLTSGGPIDIAGTLTTSGGTISFTSGSAILITAPVDATAGSAITMTSAGAIDIASAVGATTTGPITLDADSDQTGAAADALTIGASVGNANAGAITLTGAAITLGAAIDGHDALTIGPSTGAANIGLGGGAKAIADQFNISASGIADIGSDFTAVSIVTTGGTIHVDNNGTALLFQSPPILSGAAIALNSSLTTPGKAIMLVGPVTLDNTATLDTTAGGVTAGANITLTGTVTASSAGTQGLTLNAGTGGTIALSGSIGSGVALGAVTFSDKLLDLAPNLDITTSDASFSQSGGTLLLGGANAGATTIATSGGNLAFGGTIDATSAGQQTLTLTAGAGTIALSGAVGAGTALGAIALDDSTLEIGAGVGSIKSTAAFSQTGATVLQGASTTIATSGGNIGFSSTIDGATAGGQGLALQAGTGTITLSGDVGSMTRLGAVTLGGGVAAIDASLSGGAISVAGSTGILLDSTGGGAAVTSTGGQIYNGAVTLQAAATSLIDTGGNAITFESTIDGTSSGGQGLSVSTAGATIALSGNVGSMTPLGAVTLSGSGVEIDASLSGGAISVTGSAGILFDHTGGAAVTSTGGQIYSGVVTLETNTTLTDSGGNAITFENTIDGTTRGGQALSIGSSGGTIALSSNVGSMMPLGAVTLTGHLVEIDASVSGGAISVTGSTGILFDHAGAGAAVTSTGGQIYDGAVTLQAATTLTDSGGGAITFESTIDGASAGVQALSVNTGGGTIALGGTVGSMTPLGAVTLAGGVVEIEAAVSGGAISVAGSAGILIDDAGAGAAVSSTGGQTYNGAVTLEASTTLTDSGGNAIAFQDTIDGTSAGAQALGVNTAGGTIALSGDVGSMTRLGAITLAGGKVEIDASVSGGAVSVAGSTGILFDPAGAGAAVTSTGGQTYDGAVTLQAATTLIDSAGAAISFESTIDGGQALSVTTIGGTIALSGDVGSMTPLGAVTLAAGIVEIDASIAGGAISVSGSSGILFDPAGVGAAVTSTGGQTYNGVVTLEENTTLTDSGGNAFLFQSTIDGTPPGGQALSVSTSGGTIALLADVGSMTPLGAVTLTGGLVKIDASVSGGAISVAGSTGIQFDHAGGAAVTSTGGQIYNGGVTLLAATTLTDSGGGAIMFQGTIEGTSAGSQPLSVSTGGGTIGFSGNVGATTALGAVTLLDAALVLAPDIVIATSGAAISQSGATLLGGTGPGAVTLASSGGAIGFGGAIDGSVLGDQALTLNAGAGTITLAETIGATTPLGAVTLIDGLLSLGPNVGIASANAPISQTGATVLGGTSATTTTIASGDGTITFAGTIDGTSPDQQALVLSAGTGTIALAGNVGSATPLAAVTLEDALLTLSGTMEIATGGGAISQSGASVLEGGTNATIVTLASPGGAIDVAGTIDGDGGAARALSLATGTGTIALSGTVGGLVPLGAVTLTDAVLDLGANVGIFTSAAPISQSGATVLGGTGPTGTTIATSGGNIAFAGTIDGSLPGDQALTLAAGAGTISLAANVGSATPLGAVTITDGGLALAANVGISTSDAPISLSGATVLGGTGATVTTLASSGGDITLAGSLDGTTPGAQALILAADAGTIDLSGTLGKETALAALSLIDGALEIAANAAISTAGGAFLETGPFVLPGGTNAGTVTIDTTDGGLLAAGANITFSSTIDDSGEGKQALILMAGGGTIALQGNVGATTPLAALTLSDAALELGAGMEIITAGGAVSQSGPTLLGGGATPSTTTIATDAGGGSANISFGAIDGGVPGVQALTLAAGAGGTLSLLGTIGGVTPLGAVSLGGGAIALGANVGIATVNAAIMAEGPVVLQGGTSGSSVSIATQGGSIAFSSTIDGTAAGRETLTLDAGAGTVSLQGTVGSATALQALTLEGGVVDLAGNASITTAGGAVSADAPLLLVGTGATSSTIDTTGAGLVAAGAAISLVSVDGSLAGDQALTLNAGTGGAISVQTGLGSQTALGAVTLSDAVLGLGANAGITTLGGAVSQAGAILLGGATATLTTIDTTDGGQSGGANITLGAIDASAQGAQAVRLAAGTGTIALTGAAGGTTALGAVTLSDATLEIGPNGSIVSAAGAIAETGATLLVGTTATATLIETTAGVSFAGAIDGSLAGKQSLTIAGSTISLSHSIGAATPLGALSLDGAVAAGGTLGITTAGGGVAVAGAITAGGALSIDTTASGMKPAGAGILFAAGFDGGALTLNAGSGGTISLEGALGAATPLASVTLGDAVLDLGADVTITTAGGPFSQTGATLLLGGAGAAIDTAGGNIVFAGAIDGAEALTLDADSTGVIVLQGNVGKATPLGALGMSDGLLEIAPNVGIVTAGGAVSNTGPVVLLGGATTIATTGGGVATGANIEFGAGIDGATAGQETLTLAAGSQGTIALRQSVGGSTALGAVSLDAAAIDLATDAGIVTAGGAVSVTGAVVLGGPAAATTLIDTTNAGQSAAGADITLTGTVDGGTAGASALTVTAGTAGTIALAATLGSGTPLGAVTLTDKVLDIAGTIDIATSGAPVSQTGATVLQGSTAIIATAGGTVSFSGSIDGTSAGRQALTVDAGGGVIALGGAVGAQTALGAVRLDDAVLDLAADIGVTTANAAFIETGATVLQGGAVATAATIATSGGTIAFAGTIDGTSAGAQALALNAGTGTVALAGALGSGTALGAVTLADAQLDIAANVGVTTASGAFSQTGATVLLGTGAGATVIDTTAGGTAAGADIAFAGAIEGSAAGLQALALDAGARGVISVGAIGDVTALGALTFTDATLQIGADATIETAGGAILQLGATVLLGAGATANVIATASAADSAGANIIFAGPIDGGVAGEQSLTLAAGTGGTIALLGDVGATTRIGSVALSDAALDLAPGLNVWVAGSSFVELGSTVLLAGAGPTTTTITAANIYFAGTVDAGAFGAEALTLNAGAGGVGLGGAIGAVTPLGALTLTDSVLSVAASVTTAGGAIVETGATTLYAASVLDTTAGGAVPAGADVTFTGTIDTAAAGAASLAVNAGTEGTVLLLANVGARMALGAFSLSGAVLSVPANFSVVTAGGAVSLTGDTIVADGTAPTTVTVDTTGGGAVPSGANIALGDVTGSSSGPLSLTLDAGSGGTIALLGSVGSSAALAALSLTDSGLALGPNASVTTAGTPFVEAGSTVLKANGTNPTVAAIDTTDHGTRPGADIIFAGPIDGGVSGKQSLTLDSGSATVALDGSIGTATALGAMTLDDATLTLAPGVSIDIVGAAFVQSGTTLLLDPPGAGSATLVTINTGGGGIFFAGPIDGTTVGGQALSLNAGPSGTVILADNVGASVALGGLNLTGNAIDLDGSLFQTMDGAIAMTGTVDFAAPLVTIASVIPTSNNLPATTGASVSLAFVSSPTTTLTLDPGIDSASIDGGALLKIAILEGSGSSLTNLTVGSTSLGGEGTATGMTVGGFTGMFAAAHAFIRPGGLWTVNAGDVLITDPALAGLTNSVLSNEGVGTAIALMNQIQQLIARGDTGETAAQQAFLQSPDRPDYAVDPFRQRYNILGVAQDNLGGFEDLSYVTDGFWEGLLKKQ